jgi:hypothetical protein
MTDDEMITWAQMPGTASADINATAHYAALKRLIWIARTEERKSNWGRIARMAQQEHDAAALSSYPPTKETT